MIIRLTADVYTLLECIVNIRVHLNVEVLFLSHNNVTISDSLSDPISEWITNYGIGNITKPRSRNFENITFIWDVEWSLRVFINLLEYKLNPKARILRYMEDFDIIVLDTTKRI